MNDNPAERPELSTEQLLEELARRDEFETRGGPEGSEDSTLRVLKAELDTLASQIREPAPVVPFEDESDCRRVTELVEALGVEPSLARAPANDQPESKLLGELGQYQLLTKIGRAEWEPSTKRCTPNWTRLLLSRYCPNRKRATLRRWHASSARCERSASWNTPISSAPWTPTSTTRLTTSSWEYVDGVDLSELVHRVGPLPIADACELVRQAAVGLQHAHEHGLVHRDIKPSNLMVTKHGQLKILDLGLARLHNGHHGELTSTGQMMGTIDYMAPEQTGDSHDVDIRADIYALGATLFNCSAIALPMRTIVSTR